MPGWFDIRGLDETSPEDRAGFQEAQGRIEHVRTVFVCVVGCSLWKWKRGIQCWCRAPCQRAGGFPLRPSTRQVAATLLHILYTPIPSSPTATNDKPQIIQGEIAAGVPAEKIVLGGFSQGGAVTLHVCLRATTKLGGACVPRAFPFRFSDGDGRGCGYGSSPPDEGWRVMDSRPACR